MPPSDFGQRQVVAFESRRADELARLIARHGGQPLVSPSMREVPLEAPPAVRDFAHRLLTGQVDVVIFTTGVGFQYLLESVERHVDRGRFLNSLKDVVTIVRGPKPAAALRDAGITATYRVPEPHTWREILGTVDRHLAIANQTVFLQEYGKPNPSLVAGLEARGAQVINVPVYRWDLPEDLGPLEENLRRLAASQADIVLFTSGMQITHVLEVARRMGLDIRPGLQRALVASIGPTTSQMLRDEGLPVDFEPSHPHMGTLVSELAGRCQEIGARKRQFLRFFEARSLASATPRPPWYDSPFLRACRKEPVDVTPVWLMRQAGRYLPEYRRLREQVGFLELCKNPQLCSEVMVQAVEKLQVDAAIIFSDLLPILEPMGMELEYAAGEGPLIHNPLRSADDVDRVRELESVDALHYVVETVRQTRQDLPPHLPVIGFGGAPFTLASYMMEGGASRHFLHTKTLMYRDAGAWDALMRRLARAVTLYLNAQIHAGAQCVQLFDSWVGCLGEEDYQRYVLPYVRQVLGGLPPDVPAIYFATGNPALIPLRGQAGAAVVGIDWRMDLDRAWQALDHQPAIQGNLDPAVLLADRGEIRRRAQRILQQAGGQPGHIFNLGHGVLPQTPVDNVRALVDAVHEMSRPARSGPDGAGGD